MENSQLRPQKNSFKRIIKYFLTRIATITLAIVLGVYITIVISNRDGAIDAVVDRDIKEDMYKALYSATTPYDPIYGRTEVIAQLEWALREGAGLHIPKPLRNLRWTLNALTFQWGSVSPVVPTEDFEDMKPTRLVTHMGVNTTRHKVLNIIVEYLPNTLLLIGTSNLAIFLFGIPMSLYLSRYPGKWLDQLVATFSSIASIPSWVHGIILVLIFSIGLRILPMGGMFDVPPPETIGGYISMILKHMILPVTAILLSLFLQFVGTWRTYFLIYSSEDYVELAVAKGLTSRIVEREYILRPTLPYIITSFALSLIGFWQMTTALEYFFQWPGIGFLYVESLNTFDAIVTVGIVVIFAYMLSIVVLLLDIVYVIVDPRIRLMTPNERSPKIGKRSRRQVGLAAKVPRREFIQVNKISPSVSTARKRNSFFSRMREEYNSSTRRVRLFFRELIRYPSAVVGLVITLILVGMSVSAPLVSNVLGKDMSWSQQISDRSTIPMNGAPLWVNLFRKDDLPKSMILDSRVGTAQKNVHPAPGAEKQITIIFKIDYPYGEIPQDIYLYFESSYLEKRPFISATWIFPDGRQMSLESTSVISGTAYYLSDYVPRRYLSSHALQEFLQTTNTLPLYALFTDPAVEEPLVLPGTYTLQLDCLTFEEGIDVDAELILIGKAYGLAGTDNLRRDLLVPLLWGAPVALVIGLVGAILTTLVSIFIAAIASWFGGWVDNLIQRFTDVAMILPFLAIGILLMSLFDLNLWFVLALIIALVAMGSPVKSYRSALLQVKEAAYIEAAQAYGASNWRIILHYMLPRIAPMVVPQLVILIPSYVFLEATLAIFGVSKELPTWGNMIYAGLRYGAWQGNYTWFLQPIVLLVLTGFGFALLGSALERIINPRLKQE